MTLRAPASPSGADCEVQRRRLLRRYALHRDARDLEQLVVSYRPLARGLARRYLSASAGADDLEQVAYEGLIKAIHRFDPARGTAFTSFAVPTILGELRRYLRDTAWPAHVPRPLQERVREVRETATAFAARHRRIPTARDLASALDREIDEVFDALEASAVFGIASFEGTRAGAEGAERAPDERIGSEDPGYERVECLTTIEQLLPALTGQQRQALRLHFDEELGSRQIARRLGVSRSRETRDLETAVSKLRLLQHAA